MPVGDNVLHSGRIVDDSFVPRLVRDNVTIDPVHGRVPRVRGVTIDHQCHSQRHVGSTVSCTCTFRARIEVEEVGKLLTIDLDWNGERLHVTQIARESSEVDEGDASPTGAR